MKRAATTLALLPALWSTLASAEPAPISHPPSTATAQWRALTGFRSAGVLDIVPAMPAPPSVAKAGQDTPLLRLATNGGKKWGLGNYLQLDTFLYSEPVPIKALDNDWQAPLESGDVILTSDRLEAGVRWDRWQLGAIKRYDYFYRFTPDTAALVHASKNKTPLETGQRYALNLDANSLESFGVRLAYSFEVKKGLTGQAALSLLRGQEFVAGAIWGEAEAISDKDFDASFEVDYAYSEDLLFDRITPRPSGSGYAIDLALDWRPSRAWRLQLRALDLLSKILWRDAPFTTASGNSDNKQYDEQGYVIYKPVISGLESNRDSNQRIPRKLFFEGHYLLENQLVVVGRYANYEIKDFWSAGLGYQWGESLAGLLYDPASKAWALRLDTPLLRFELGSDATTLDQAHLLSFGLALAWRY